MRGRQGAPRRSARERRSCPGKRGISLSHRTVRRAQMRRKIVATVQISLVKPLIFIKSRPECAVMPWYGYCEKCGIFHGRGLIMIKRQSGFTLIEIAIVLVIIGLLLGGVLKG